MARKLSRKKIPVEIDGVVYDLSSPSLGQLESIDREEKEKAGHQTIALVVALGLPEDVAMSLDINMLKELFEILAGKNPA